MACKHRYSCQVLIFANSPGMQLSCESKKDCVWFVHVFTKKCSLVWKITYPVGMFLIILSHQLILHPCSSLYCCLAVTFMVILHIDASILHYILWGSCIQIFILHLYYQSFSIYFSFRFSQTLYRSFSEVCDRCYMLSVNLFSAQ